MRHSHRRSSRAWPVLAALLLGGALAFTAAGNAGAAVPTDDQIDSILSPTDRTASALAREELTAARVALMRAQSGVVANDRAIAAAMEQRPEYRSLQLEVQRARARYESIQRPVLDALARDEAYARLHAEVDSARDTMAKLADSQRDDFLTLLPLAKKALEAGREMTRAEVIALALDPAVEDARQEMIVAYGKLRRVSSGIRREAAQSENVRIAIQDLEAARARVEAAQTSLADALQREADADRLRDRRAELLRSGRPIDYRDEPGRKRPPATTGPTTKPAK